MPMFEFVEMRSRNDLDRRRQRMSVRVRPRDGGAPLFLGDVWCGTANGRWYYTSGPGNPRRMGKKDGYDNRDQAAEAMLDEHMSTAMEQLQESLTSVNTLRMIAEERELHLV